MAKLERFGDCTDQWCCLSPNQPNPLKQNLKKRSPPLGKAIVFFGYPVLPINLTSHQPFKLPYWQPRHVDDRSIVHFPSTLEVALLATSHHVPSGTGSGLAQAFPSTIQVTLLATQAQTPAETFPSTIQVTLLATFVETQRSLCG